MEKIKEWKKLIASNKRELEKIEEALSILEHTKRLESFLKTNSKCHPITISVSGIGPLFVIKAFDSKAGEQLRKDLISVFQMYRNTIAIEVEEKYTEMKNNFLNKED